MQDSQGHSRSPVLPLFDDIHHFLTVSDL